jgi:hypothetical protein
MNVLFFCKILKTYICEDRRDWEVGNGDGKKAVEVQINGCWILDT